MSAARGLAGVVLVGTVVATGAGCGVTEAVGISGPTVEGFCDTYWEQKEAYVAKYDERAELTDQMGEQDPFAGILVGLGSSVEAMGDVVVIFDHLADEAPDDIKPDVVVIRDALQKSIDSAGDSLSDPLGGLAGNLVSGLATIGSWERLGTYVVDNCGEQG